MFRNVLTISLLVILVFQSSAFSQGQSSVAGVYEFVSETRTVDGQTTEVSGNSGRLVLDPAGSYIFTTIKTDLPKVATGNRMTATPDEARQIVAGSLTHFGRYKVVDNALVFTVERATFANWNGIEQKRAFTLDGDQLKYSLPVASGGGSVTLTWRRLK